MIAHMNKYPISLEGLKDSTTLLLIIDNFHQLEMKILKQMGFNMFRRLNSAGDEMIPSLISN